MTDVVVRSVEAGLTVIRLNRPAARNAINVPLLETLVSALRASRDDDAIVIEGAGPSFCAGEDLKETLAPNGGGADELRRSFELLQETTRLITSARGAVVAAVRGHAIGGGAELALATDLVVAGPDARLRFPETSLGHAVTGGITARLPALIGLLRAKELLLTSRWVDADEALALGLVNEVVSDPEARAREIAGSIAAFPQRSVAAVKRTLELGAVPNQEGALHLEVEAATHCFASVEADASHERFRQGGRQ